MLLPEKLEELQRLHGTEVPTKRRVQKNRSISMRSPDSGQHALVARLAVGPQAERKARKGQGQRHWLSEAHFLNTDNAVNEARKTDQFATYHRLWNAQNSVKVSDEADSWSAGGNTRSKL